MEIYRLIHIYKNCEKNSRSPFVYNTSLFCLINIKFVMAYNKNLGGGLHTGTRKLKNCQGSCILVHESSGNNQGVSRAHERC